MNLVVWYTNDWPWKETERLLVVVEEVALAAAAALAGRVRVAERERAGRGELKRVELEVEVELRKAELERVLDARLSEEERMGEGEGWRVVDFASLGVVAATTITADLDRSRERSKFSYNVVSLGGREREMLRLRSGTWFTERKGEKGKSGPKERGEGAERGSVRSREEDGRVIQSFRKVTVNFICSGLKNWGDLTRKTN